MLAPGDAPVPFDPASPHLNVLDDLRSGYRLVRPVWCTSCAGEAGVESRMKRGLQVCVRAHPTKDQTPRVVARHFLRSLLAVWARNAVLLGFFAGVAGRATEADGGRPDSPNRKWRAVLALLC